MHLYLSITRRRRWRYPLDESAPACHSNIALKWLFFSEKLQKFPHGRGQSPSTSITFGFWGPVTQTNFSFECKLPPPLAKSWFGAWGLALLVNADLLSIFFFKDCCNNYLKSWDMWAFQWLQFESYDCKIIKLRKSTTWVIKLMRFLPCTQLQNDSVRKTWW